MAITESEFCELLERAKRGEIEAVGALFASVRPYLLTIARDEIEPYLRTKGSGNDLVQESFLEAQGLLMRFDGKTVAELRAWLRAVLLNKVGDFRRQFIQCQKRQVDRERPIQGPDSDRLFAKDPTPSSLCGHTEETAAIEAALAQLPESYRQIIQLRNGEGLTFAEVGQQLGKSEDAARMAWGRAILCLQQTLVESR